ncbi:MAG: ADP-forming succinate--CoA ligase subunit beta [Pseudomonadota bacterium]
MNLHEYQSKQLFADAGIPVPQGKAVTNADDAIVAAREIGTDVVVVKAQVHAGGRGKGGGVKVVRSPEEAGEAATGMLGTQLVTPQTTAQGLPVGAVLVEAGSAIAKEFYLGLLLDRGARRLTFLASAAGGMDIEHVAATTPEKIVRAVVNPAAGLQPFQIRRLAFGLGLTEKDQMKSFSKIVTALYDLYLRHDASLVEINPLIVTEGGDLLALDAKINIEDNALFRQPAIALLRDESQEDEMERVAHDHDLNYVSLDGDIACMVNGAGLAMATMDIIQLHGGSPANFLDVGGNATSERVSHAFRLILSNERVTAILINIFGGIVRCDLIAEGIIDAVQTVGVPVPVVVRLEGTNAAKGRELLAASGLAIIPAEDLTDAASKVVAAAGEKA